VGIHPQLGPVVTGKCENSDFDGQVTLRGGRKEITKKWPSTESEMICPF